MLAQMAVLMFVGMLLGTPGQEGGWQSCAVTAPNGYTPPGGAPLAERHGNDSLWTISPKDGVITDEWQRGRPDGSVIHRLGWERQVWGGLFVEGRRLDGPAPPLEVHMLRGFGLSGAQVTDVVFPTEGCWKIMAFVGENGVPKGPTLSFTVRVVRLGEAPMPRAGEASWLLISTLAVMAQGLLGCGLWLRWRATREAPGSPRK